MRRADVRTCASSRSNSAAASLAFAGADQFVAPKFAGFDVHTAVQQYYSAVRGGSEREGPPLQLRAQLKCKQ
eukprot:3625335-Pleurochrysis_carterae.AAC.1